MNLKLVQRALDKPATAERFWAQVDRSGGPDACWPWTGRRDEKGYGRLGIHVDGEQSTLLAHRVAWMLKHGARPSSVCILHDPKRCNHPWCCNDAHLREGDRRDNALDTVIAGTNYWANRTHCFHGHPLDGVRGNGLRYCLECNRIWARRNAQARA